MKLTLDIIENHYVNLYNEIIYDIDGNILCRNCHITEYELCEHTQTMKCPHCGDKLNISLEEYYKWTQNQEIKQRIDNLETKIFPLANIVYEIIENYKSNSKEYIEIDTHKYNIYNQELLNAVLSELQTHGYGKNLINIF